MPKLLSLKKSCPSKNQKAITHFFKSTNISSNKEITSSVKDHSSQEVCIEKKAVKRKILSPVYSESIEIFDEEPSAVKTTSSIISNANHKINKSTPKKLKDMHHMERLPMKQDTKSVKRSPQKEKSVKENAASNNIINHENLLNNEDINNSPDFEKSKDRSPLTPVFIDNAENSNLLQLNVTENHVLNNGSPKKNILSKNGTPSLNNKKLRISKESPNGDICCSLRTTKSITPQKVSENEQSPSKSGSTVRMLDFDQHDVDDMFTDGWDIADVDMEEFPEDLDLSTIQRCEILRIIHHPIRLELKLKNASNNKGTCFIEGIWLDTPLSPGEVISVIATRDSSGQFCVSNTAGLMALRPDHLVSSTSVVAGVYCKRKAILQERWRGIDSANAAMTIGILVHELVQKALVGNIMTVERLYLEADKILKESIQMLYDADLKDEEARSSLHTYIPPLAEFMQTYVGNKSPSVPQRKNDNWHGHIDNVLDIEENICCPQLGLKGKIDATLEVTIHERKGRQQATVPLELKSGKATMSAEHRGQLVLYGMMLSLQQNQDPTRDIQRGLLLYLRERVDLREVSCGYPERRDLMMLRNQMVQHLATGPEDVNSEELADIEDAAQVLAQRLPEPVHNEMACAKCPYLTLCSLHLWHTNSSIVSDTHPLAKLRGQALGHVTSHHIKYFFHWTALIKMEERGQMATSPLNALWIDSFEKRERRGTCAANLKLKSVEPLGDRYLHVFETKNTAKDDTKLENGRVKGPQQGEFSIVSIDNRPWIAAGVVSVTRDNEIHIVLERDLSRRLSDDTVYHIDTYESYATNIQNLTNLGALMDDTDRALRLRRLIIDKECPEFDKKLPREVGRLGAKLMKSLNIQQQRAVLKALAAKDYTLLQGLPGTGKTQTISVLIQMLVGLQQRVLVTAHTHSAVDTVLNRLPDTLRVMRLGSSARVAAGLQTRCEQHLTADCKTPQQLAQVYDSMDVVGVTCLGANHTMLTRTVFDVCIVDEATQVLQCTVLRPLFATKRFVLVGDPDQLPPVVRSRTARRLGMEESLFHRLMNEEATSTLQLQYRMNRPLTDVANRVAYNERLKCADEKVASAKLQLDLKKITHLYATKAPWLMTACSQEIEDAALFLDTKCLDVKVNNECSSKTCENVNEACLIMVLVEALKEGGVKPSEIGVIAPYRDQVSLLRRCLSRFSVEVSTVDQFQGRDKSVIIYSCTKRDDQQDVKEGEILNDQRRLAVSVTRAKHKLLVIGNSRALQRYAPLEKLIDACKVLPLEKNTANLIDDYRTFLL